MASRTAADPRRLEYTPVDDIKETEGNPKDHDLGKVIVSIARLGYTEPVLLDERTGRLVSGNGRTTAVRAIHAWKTGDNAALEWLGVKLPPSTWNQVDKLLPDDSPPQGITVDGEGRWLIPVIRGWASKTDHEARTAVIAANKLSEAGGWNERQLAEWLDDIAGSTPDLLEATGYDTASLDALLKETSVLASRAEEFFSGYGENRLDEPAAPPAATFSHPDSQQPTGQKPAAPPAPTPASTAPATEAEPAEEPDAEPQSATPAPSKPSGPSGPTYVNVSWVVDVEERARIRQVLRHVQDQHGLETSAAALVALVDRYITEHQLT